MKPQMNTDEHRADPPQPKNKGPRTHLSQVRSPAFRLPWVHSRLASIAEGSKPLTREEREILRTHALAYIGLLRAHIQKEGKEFYPVFLGAHASSVLQMSRSTGRYDFFSRTQSPLKEIWQMTNDQ